jgi:hypothetical protein
MYSTEEEPGDFRYLERDGFMGFEPNLIGLKKNGIFTVHVKNYSRGDGKHSRNT